MTVLRHSATATLDSPLAEELREDLLGSWVPDVAGHHDLDRYGANPATAGSHVCWQIAVPRPDGRSMTVRALHPRWHARLHQAVKPIREILDASLGAGVFGYRRGAEANRRYADDWRAFCAYVDEQSQHHALVVMTDVRAFFAHAPWSKVISALEPVVGADALGAVRDVADGLARGGVPTLPTGYSDARLLANAVLRDADADLTAPWARWVDDYRLFADSPDEAESRLAALDQGLMQLGLERNSAKTRTLPAATAIERHHKTLASVYHPDRDSAEILRTRLRDVLGDATADPVGHRRQLRFVLPRLAEQQDDAAVDFALNALTELPWEAPRLVAYLAAFPGEERVIEGCRRVLHQAAAEANVWLCARLAALACRVGIDRATADSLLASPVVVRHEPASGLITRALALAGDDRGYRAGLRSPAPDARALLAAARDLDIHPPDWLRDMEPELADALITDPAPAPPIRTLL